MASNSSNTYPNIGQNTKLVQEYFMMTTDGLQTGKPSIINHSHLNVSQTGIKFQSLFTVFIAENEWQSSLQRKLNYAALQHHILGSRLQHLCTVKIAIYSKLSISVT